VAVTTPIAVDSPITLGQFVKLAGLAGTGGEAKILVSSGMVLVNGRIETRRGHKLAAGDIVEAGGQRAQVRPESEPPEPPRPARPLGRLEQS
jgi:ribosome-associated protein